MEDLRDLVSRLWAWAQLHPVRAWICVLILILLALFVVAGIQNSQA